MALLVKEYVEILKYLRKVTRESEFIGHFDEEDIHNGHYSGLGDIPYSYGFYLFRLRFLKIIPEPPKVKFMTRHY